MVYENYYLYPRYKSVRLTVKVLKFDANVGLANFRYVKIEGNNPDGSFLFDDVPPVSDVHNVIVAESYELIEKGAL